MLGTDPIFEHQREICYFKALPIPSIFPSTLFSSHGSRLTWIVERFVRCNATHLLGRFTKKYRHRFNGIPNSTQITQRVGEMFLNRSKWVLKQNLTSLIFVADKVSRLECHQWKKNPKKGLPLTMFVHNTQLFQHALSTRTNVYCPDVTLPVSCQPSGPGMSHKKEPWKNRGGNVSDSSFLTSYENGIFYFEGNDDQIWKASANRNCRSGDRGTDSRVLLKNACVKPNELGYLIRNPLLILTSHRVPKLMNVYFVMITVTLSRKMSWLSNHPGSSNQKILLICPYGWPQMNIDEDILLPNPLLGFDAQVSYCWSSIVNQQMIS